MLRPPPIHPADQAASAALRSFLPHGPQPLDHGVGGAEGGRHLRDVGVGLAGERADVA